MGQWAPCSKLRVLPSECPANWHLRSCLNHVACDDACAGEDCSDKPLEPANALLRRHSCLTEQECDTTER